MVEGVYLTEKESGAALVTAADPGADALARHQPGRANLEDHRKYLLLFVIARPSENLPEGLHVIEVTQRLRPVAR